MEGSAEIINEIGRALLSENKAEAQDIIKNKYPFTKKEISKRSYTDIQKMKLFMRDGFIDSIQEIVLLFLEY